MIVSEQLGTRQLCHLIGAQPASRIAITALPFSSTLVLSMKLQQGFGLHYPDLMIVSPDFRALPTKRRERQGRSALFKADILSVALSMPPAEATAYNSSAF